MCGLWQGRWKSWFGLQAQMTRSPFYGQRKLPTLSLAVDSALSSPPLLPKALLQRLCWPPHPQSTQSPCSSHGMTITLLASHPFLLLSSFLNCFSLIVLQPLWLFSMFIFFSLFMWVLWQKPSSNKSNKKENLIFSKTEKLKDIYDCRYSWIQSKFSVSVFSLSVSFPLTHTHTHMHTHTYTHTHTVLLLFLLASLLDRFHRPHGLQQFCGLLVHLLQWKLKFQWFQQKSWI
jgi:hypothetical protein